MRSSPTGPALQPPGYLTTHLGERTHWILDHGFDTKSVGPDWWNRELHRQGLPQVVALTDHDGERLLTRADLFRLGSRATSTGADDDAVLTFLWHVLAWGTDSSQRGNRKRIEVLAAHEARRQRLPPLRDALAAAAHGDPRSAYDILIRTGRSTIPGLGPSFFTKALYFASETAPGTRCLILDSRVATRLREAGWASLAYRGSNFGTNWLTPTYAAYCELLQEWAAQATRERGHKIWPDEFERGLFEGPSVERV